MAITSYLLVKRKAKCNEFWLKKMITKQDASDLTAIPQFSLRTLLVFIMIASLSLAAVSMLRQRAARTEAELDRLAKLAKLDKATLRQVVKDVAAIRDRLGRAPKDKAELESLLGKKLPGVHDQGHPIPIFYERTGEDSFLLVYTLWASDDWIYDSTKPQAGWVQHHY